MQRVSRLVRARRLRPAIPLTNPHNHQRARILTPAQLRQTAVFRFQKARHEKWFCSVSASTAVKWPGRRAQVVTAIVVRAFSWVPSLRGKKWLWSDGSYAGIAKTITEGMSQPKQYRSPMPPMGGVQLTPEEVSAVAAHVCSLSHQASPRR
jgi:hypothetical protein